MLTAERLRSVLSYDQESGLFTWLVATSRRIRVGAQAGSVSKRDGYIELRIDGELYKAHRLAFLYMNGEWPKEDVDHIDGRRANNRWVNLRDVSRRVNQQNRHRAQANNSNGMLGVTRDKRRPGFVARIKLPGNSSTTHLGQFKTAEEAHTAYLAAKRVNHTGCTI